MAHHFGVDWGDGIHGDHAAVNHRAVGLWRSTVDGGRIGTYPERVSVRNSSEAESGSPALWVDVASMPRNHRCPAEIGIGKGRWMMKIQKQRGENQHGTLP